jgi:hypothetical protein
MAPINDPFPTTKLTVPYLSEVLERLRDPKAQRVIVICHAKSPEEGEWILATTAARMQRNGVKVVGPESTAPVSLMELALREKAEVALVTGIHTPQDAHALRAASGMGLKIAGVLCAPTVDEFKAFLNSLGPWAGYNLMPLTRTPLPPR